MVDPGDLKDVISHTFPAGSDDIVDEVFALNIHEVRIYSREKTEIETN